MRNVGNASNKFTLRWVIERFFLLALVLNTTPSSSKPFNTISIASEAEYPPFSDESLSAGGLFPAITTAVFKNLDLSTKIVFMPFQRALLSTEHLKTLALVGASKNASREKKFYYSIPIYEVKQVFFARDNMAASLTKEQDISGLKVCRPVGNNLKFIQKFLDANQLTLFQPETFRQCFEMLNLKRVDLVQVSYAVGQHMLRQLYNNDPKISPLEFPLSTNTVHFVISRKNPDGQAWIEKINASYQALSDSGEINQLVRDYLARPQNK